MISIKNADFCFMLYYLKSVLNGSRLLETGKDVNREISSGLGQLGLQAGPGSNGEVRQGVG